MTPDERLHRYARLAVEVGVNLQPGQLLRVTGHPDHLAFSRAIAEVAYAAGARYVEVILPDPHVQRSRLRHAPEDTLDWSPPWWLALVDELASTNGALIAITGDPEPELFGDLDPARIAMSKPRLLAERVLKATGDGRIAWTIVGSGRRSPQRRDSTRTIRSPRGGRTSRACGRGRHSWTSAASTRSASAAPAPTSRWG